MGSHDAGRAGGRPGWLPALAALMRANLVDRGKRAILAGAEGVWAAAFAAAGRLGRRPIDLWASPGGQRVLVIAPHPDDEAAGCAGTILRHRQCGDRVTIACVTDGRRSRALGLGPDEMARRRRQEAEAAAAILGVDRFEWLGCPEGEWSLDELRPRLSALLAEWAPDVVYAPSRIDFHPEHQKVAHALGGLCQATSAEPDPFRIRIYQIQVPLTSLLTNLVSPTSAVTVESVAAFRAYETQQGSMRPAFRSRRYSGAYHRAGTHAEEFWEMTARGYHRLHRSSPAGWRRDRFRSLRPRSLTDPLAYLHGRAERRRLRALVDGADESG